MIVDTGEGSSITFSADAWKGLAAADRTMTTAISFGLGGPIVTDLAVVPELRLGQLTASDVEVRVERGGGFSQEVGAGGRIGASFLQRYRVLLDPGAGRMVLAPGRNDTAPPHKSTSGLLVRADGQNGRGHD